MSNPEREREQGNPVLEEFQRLGSAVEAAVHRIRKLGRELDEARAQASRLEDQLRRFTGGEEAPSELLARLGRLEGENRVLRERLEKGREGVERMLARIRFLEEQG